MVSPHLFLVDLLLDPPQPLHLPLVFLQLQPFPRRVHLLDPVVFRELGQHPPPERLLLRRLARARLLLEPRLHRVRGRHLRALPLALGKKNEFQSVERPLENVARFCRPRTFAKRERFWRLAISREAVSTFVKTTDIPPII